MKALDTSFAQVESSYKLSLDVYPCASNCGSKGALQCKGCALVCYCSASCQLANWEVHKATCKSPLTKPTWKPIWEVQNRMPEWISSEGGMDYHGEIAYLWGNVPALDILQLSEAEYALLKREEVKNVALCFAASGDARNVLTTFSSITDPRKIGKIDIAMNDKNQYVSIRNLATFLLLFHYPPTIAAELILHLSYSIFLTTSQYQAIETTLRGYLDKVDYGTGSKSTVVNHLFEFEGGNKALASLTVAEWNTFDQILKLRFSKKRAMERWKHIMLGRPDRIDRYLEPLKPYDRVAFKGYRESGLMLPYSQFQNSAYTKTNPFLFNPNTFNWMMLDSSTPEQGWDVDKAIEFGAKLGVPKNDIFGNLNFYIRDIICRASERLHGLNGCQIRLTCVDARNLSSVLAAAPVVQNIEKPEWIFTQFDRIEVSNICDEQYLGIKTVLTTFGPLLRPKNPDATLLTLFINAARMSIIQDGPRPESITKAMRLFFHNPMVAQQFINNPVKTGRVLELASYLTDFSHEFELHMRAVGFNDAARRAGLKRRVNQRIISQWPFGIIQDGPGENIKSQVYILDRHGLGGAECYLEWVRD
ncbi:hypothetical protein DFH27DRAFT_488154 [Peziza echinospora]|nr:hypothetical protein DFH27DRAFT_488154 [Peziza echinospora]